MVYWLMSGILLFIIGSVLWMAPSGRERQLARLRQAALTSGFRIQAGVARKESSLANLIAQYPALASADWTRYSLLKQTPTSAENHSDHTWQLLPDTAGQWQWQAVPGTPACAPEPLQTALARWQQPLAGHLLAVSLTPQGASFVWDERGSLADLADFSQVLRQQI